MYSMDILFEPKHEADISSLNILRTIARTSTVATLHGAVSAGDLCLVRLLIEHGEIIDDKSFQTACKRGHTEIVRLLLALGARENEALRIACRNGHTEIMRLLLDLPLKSGVNPAVNDN